MYERQKGNSTAGFAAILFIGCIFAAWITHIIHCLSEETWGFLIAGAIMFPIGIIHGVGLWFGAF